eukprot:3559030-Amphidinium_carterae.1
MTNCKVFGGDRSDSEALQCISKSGTEAQRLGSYFGCANAPRWMLGMGWVFGKHIADYIARNSGRLKLRGAADVSLGIWLAPLEGVDFVDMGAERDRLFHDHPGTRIPEP